MAEPLRHRQTKEAATDMFYLTLPRHISALPKYDFLAPNCHFRSTPNSGLCQSTEACISRHHPLGRDAPQ